MRNMTLSQDQVAAWRAGPGRGDSQRARLEQVQRLR